MELRETQECHHKGVAKIKECKVLCKERRWLMLVIFFLVEMSSIVQMVQFISIARPVTQYFNNSYIEVSWTSLIMLVSSSVLATPTVYIINRLGLRRSLLFGVVGTSMGSWIKLMGISPESFWMLIFGQTIVSVAHVLIASLPTHFVLIWFGGNKAAMASRISIFTTSISVALGFLLPTLIIDSTSNRTIEDGLFGICLAYALLPTILIVITFYGFPDRPPSLPIFARAHTQAIAKVSNSYLKILKEITTTVPFLCLMFLYGLNYELFYTINILLNQLILNRYADGTSDVGNVGFLINSTSILGAIAVTIILNKFKRLKLMIWTVNIFHVISTSLFCFLFDQEVWVLYLLAVLYGFSFGCVLPVGIELGVELTYPAPESVVQTLLKVFPWSVGFTYLYFCVSGEVDQRIALVVLCGIQILANVSIIFVKLRLKKQEMLNSKIVLNNRLQQI